VLQVVEMRGRRRKISKDVLVSQDLLSRFFGSKKELVERLYERNFISRSRDDWLDILSDR
jgi:hypothetical protein